MTPTAILGIVLQILAMAPTLVQAVQAVEKLKELTVDGREPSDAEIQALLDTLNQQSDEIQGMATADKLEDEGKA